MTTSTAIQRPDTHDMIVVHRVFRRESDLMPTLIQAVRDGDTARAEVLAGAFADYQLGLHLHHSAEDELVWPLLLARVDLEADLVLRMEAQHEVVARTLAETSQRMPAWRAAPSAATAAPLLSALAEHRAALLEHLHDEEEYILPLIAEHLTVAEWARLGERFASEVPRSKMLFFLGMILEDADPAERQAMMTNLPAPARFAWKAFGQRQFRRRVSKIRAVLPGQVPLDRAAGRARPGPAAPAVAAQHAGHLGGGLAGLPLDLRPAVPQRLLPVRGGGVVPGLVPPPVLGLVGEPPVELDDHAEGLVHAVPPAPAAARLGERHLPGRLRQPVRPLYVPVVTELQHRVVPGRRRCDELLQVGAPAQPEACAHGRVEPALVGKLPRDGPGHPAAHVVKGLRGLRQVKHRLLDPGPGRLRTSERGLDRPPRPVQADSLGR